MKRAFVRPLTGGPRPDSPACIHACRDVPGLKDRHRLDVGAIRVISSLWECSRPMRAEALSA
jgi:hypothetical protein